MQTSTGKIFWAGLLIAVMVLGAPPPGAEAARKGKKPAQTSQLYLQQGQNIIKLTQGDLIFRTALSLGEDNKVGLYGLAREPAVKAELHPLEIVVFDPETGGDKVHLTRLAYVETSPAAAFDLNVNKLNAENFQKIYKMAPDAPIPINLWCVQAEIPLQITAVPQKPGWFSLTPREQLTPGNYAVNSGTLDGPRLFTGDHGFYPFALVTALPPAAKAKKAVKKARKRAKPKEEVALATPPQPRAPLAPEAPPPPSLAAGFIYQGAPAKSPRTRREYQITNLDNQAWHNVRIKIYARDNDRFVLGPVTQEKNVVLPGHTVNQVPDKTFMHYDTLDDAGYNIYLEISAKEGTLKKAWKNVPADEAGESNLMEIPWDLQEPDRGDQ
ncbi:MAG: hypothetical protein ACYDIC_11100 [Desulfobaccales bacterium]